MLNVYRRCRVRVFGSTLPMAPKAVCSIVGCDHKGFKGGSGSMIKVTTALLCLPAGMEYKDSEEAERYICSTHKKKIYTARNAESQRRASRSKTMNFKALRSYRTGSQVRACTRAERANERTPSRFPRSSTIDLTDSRPRTPCRTRSRRSLCWVHDSAAAPRPALATQRRLSRTQRIRTTTTTTARRLPRT